MGADRHHDAGRALRSPLDALPGDVRQAVVLRIVDHVEYAEIASRLGCTELEARRRVALGLRVLRGRR
jgi:DNA-directed RNA polymerase specialized sigma24 family protein